jgi:transcriptional regulator with XRE-family HTH domain
MSATYAATRTVPLRDIRRSRGLSQSELATMSGLARETVSRLERGLTRPGRGTLLLLAASLGCAVDELTDPTDESSPAGELGSTQTTRQVVEDACPA